MDEDQFSEEERKKIYDNLADLMIEALEKGLISDEEASSSAEFILSRFDSVKTKEELEKFFIELTGKWSIYNKAFLELKTKKLENQDQEKLKELTDKLNHFIQ